MPRAAIIAIIVAILVVAGLVWLAGRPSAVPLRHIEQPVTIGNAADDAKK